ncbi:proline--tRNA ligase [Anaeromassilibacillus senegalensis]|uniref:Proline--tRNA ligase n=1 Tax=Anaeromassilibacillus senegalensis TaxID=1673717 RepID=A0ABS9CP37_9FIRM|nr:proline--tRNA ligase [Anaeromassilibacillus senegalensis]MCF2651947.1 proline--tRNA ligase [Anaeromassilibacillus senegalensis]
MKLEKLVGDRFREKPADCVVESHALMLRGGYMKGVSNGIYSSYMPLRRITRKIEQILREEMDAIDGQEVQFPVVMPASLWQESGRYESIGKELMRFTDRNQTPLVLGMTHEEAAVQLVREYGQSYTRYPFMIYQIQTKFRDEARPRAGLIRVREFTMKDGYSFHTDQADLEAYYKRCLEAYRRIYARVGIPEVLAVASDSGMMGGSVSHEFMLLTPIGEDSIAICEACGYRANMEAAECIVRNVRDAVSHSLERVHTPDCHTIEELCAFFGCEKKQTCKAVVYQQNTDNRYVVLFLRGDLEVNETKLTNVLGCAVRPAEITPESGLAAGFISPCGLNADCTVLFDRSLQNTDNLICGANRQDYHYIGLDMARDVGAVEYRDFAKIAERGICPHCGAPAIHISRGIEVGNIFQLGTKYTEAMGMTYQDEDGNTHHPVMGCYGIGVGRLAAAVCEAHHDDFGPIWPVSIAPWQVHLCAVRADNDAVRACADALYEQLQARGAEVIYDDRTVSAGVMFSDADLLGVPLRVIVSPRNLKQGIVEVASRDKTFSKSVPLETAAESVMHILNGMMHQ